MRILAIGVLGVAVVIASLVCLLSSMCAAAGGVNGSDRAGFALCALVSLGVAIGGIVLIGKLN
jgi:hypothetical protein